MFTKRSSCYVNLMQYHEDSLKESLKKTMLNQENLFRKQVLELHRLYQMQMILMKNLRLKEVPTTQSLNYFKQDCKVDWARYDQRPLDLEVPVSSYVSNFDRHVLNKGRNSWGTRENPVEVDDYFHVETGTSLGEAKLSLSIGRETSPRMSCWRSQNKDVCVLHDTIEVEESIGTMFSRDVELKPALCRGACSAHTGQRNGSGASYNCPNSTDKYLSNKDKKFQSHRDESTNIFENSNLGNKKWLENLPETESTVGEVFPSHGGIFLDLNAHPDESFSDSKHPRESPGAGSWTNPNDNCSTQASALLQHDTPSSVLIDCKRTESTNPSGNKPCSIDLESYPLSPSNSSEDDDCKCKMDKPMQDVPSRNCKDENVTEVIVEKAEQVFLHSCLRSSEVEDVAIVERSPELSKSDHIAEDPSSSLKTMQSGTNLEKSFSRMNSFQNSDSSQVDSFAIGESKAARSSDEDNGGSGQDDPAIQKGAVSFIYFLLEARREHDSISKIEKKIDQPECSIDSFASTVLKMPDCNTDDYCVSSNPYEIIETDKKDCGIKLRRGRRLKDFQKEILPSLPSLSRQEICEDIRIMEGAIRSREYKRYRSKVSNEQNWFTPVRSRRSRLNYIGRRCYK